MEFFATCGRGLEALLGDELRAIGVHGVRPLRAGVSFSGDMRDAYLACLWSRIASRVLMTVARVDAHSADSLYEDVRRIAWEDHIPLGKTIAFSARGTNANLRDTRFTALRAKDALCDRLRALRGERPDVDTVSPDVRISINVRNEKATISIDLSGTALEQRGYRAPGKPQGAPLHDNLAAAMLMAAGWGREDGPRGLVNPLCASGTLAIEAAMMSARIAPGIMRAHWGFEGIAEHNPGMWDDLLDQADYESDQGRGHVLPIIACDADAAALEYARACARRASVADCITFVDTSKEDAPTLESLGARGAGLLMCNLPSIEHAVLAQLPLLYARILDAARSDARVGTLALLSDDGGLDAHLGMEASTTLDVMNGRAEESLRVYDLEGELNALDATVKVRDTQIAVSDAAAQQFASRLNKVYKQRRKWAAKEQVYAYRVYDADLPDYNMAIDLYCGAGPDKGKRLVHVAEYAAPRDIDAAKASRRIADALRIIPVVFEVDPKDVYLKRRVRAKGGSQYSGTAGLGEDGSKSRAGRLITKENGLLFEVDLADYLDTGLFLDHRNTRVLLRMLAKDKSFLNLFAYTGTASVYAAAGKAKFTTTVDISNTYQQWAMRNMKLNRLLDRHQEFVRADVLAWVQEKRHSKERWDLIFVDPPTFSNSSKMGTRDWDVQRDHAELLIGVSRLLTREGVAVFSCNLRKFKPDVETLAKAGVIIRDISDKTIPSDFERNPKVHRCYLLKRG